MDLQIWDPRQKDEPVASLEAKDAESARDCWCVGFGNSYNNEEVGHFLRIHSN